jgi:hypothetical protein
MAALTGLDRGERTGPTPTPSISSVTLRATPRPRTG